MLTRVPVRENAGLLSKNFVQRHPVIVGERSLAGGSPTHICGQ
ncbi:MAG: hypothetical protein ABIM89_13585 [Mycobacteriales bacterium]